MFLITFVSLLFVIIQCTQCRGT